MVDWKKTILEKYAKDKFASKIPDDKIENNNYVIKEGLIMRRNKILLVPNSMIKERILQALHDTHTIGHP